MVLGAPECAYGSVYHRQQPCPDAWNAQAAISVADLVPLVGLVRGMTRVVE